MKLAKLLSRWRADSFISGNFTAQRIESSRLAVTGPFPEELNQRLKTALMQQGIQSLYSHQIAAWNAVRAGKHSVIVTGTASGKTLCYNLPVLNSLLENDHSTAIYLFPTKALAQDQLTSLLGLLREAGIDTDLRQSDIQKSSRSPATDPGPLFSLPIAAYDGDTPTAARSKIRNSARGLLTNPDMLHIGILPHHASWNQFFGRLKFIIIDEMHSYRGVFGSHIANVIRRLLRILDFYKTKPTFILTSATIANPEQLASKLTGKEFEVIHEDGSSRGRRHFYIYNPPIIDQELGIRRSAYHESVRLAQDLLNLNIQSLIFGRSRRTVELIVSYLRQSVNDQKHDTKSIIRGYRSGYLKEDRREIELGIRRGEVIIAAATNALELGVDIGGMDTVLMVGYPGTIAATKQQAGRAGRGKEDALAILIATPDPLDQYLANHPEYLFNRPTENALINPDNLLILLDHIRCAAFELPFQLGDTYGNLPADSMIELLDFLVGQRVLHKSGNKFFWMTDHYPASSVSLRTSSAETVVLYNDELSNLPNNRPRTIGHIDKSSALWMVHPDAIYIHEGDTYYVKSLDLEKNIALLRPIETEYYTLPIKRSEVAIETVLHKRETPNYAYFSGDVEVTEKVTGFRKIKWYTHEIIDVHELSLPSTQLYTSAYWITLANEMISILREDGTWTGDPIDYGPNWNKVRNMARSRDNYTCQYCSVPETSSQHHVHHKIPFKYFHSYEQANVLENLVTLCPTCHRIAEASVRVKSGLAGLGYVLSNIAPLSLMCDRRDLGVHTDPQSRIAGGEPVVLLYEQIPAGIGLSEQLFESHNEILVHAYELVAECKCSNGCPSCVGPGSDLGYGGKQETLAILERLVN